MKGLRVQFLSVEPLIISDGTTEGLTHKCLDFIPGNMLLGALAAKWKKMNPGVDPDSSKEFCALFLQNKVSFGHVWPNCQGRPAYPTPLSLVYEKNSKGLPALELNATEPPKVYNLLADPKLDFATQEFNHLPSTFLDLETKHVPALKRLHVTHIGIDPKKRLVSDFQIFSYEAISSGVSWICTIVCEDDTLSSLQKLFKDPTPLQLGHGRSSGYGSIRLIKVNPLDIKSDIEVTPGEHSLYLESAFFPDNSWKNPIEALVQLLESSLKAKVELNLNKTYIENFRLEGFNSLWRLPRSTRFGLAQGSVITFSTDKKGKLPLFLGNFSQEGYGRICLDLPLLKEAQIVPATLNLQDELDNQRPATEALPILNVWRQRSIKRLAQTQALDLIWHSPIFEPLFAALKFNNKPSQSQRGNIRNLLMSTPHESWCQTFSNMLTKQPGRQWKTVRVPNPFVGYKQRGNLDEIMLRLLDLSSMEAWIKTFDQGAFSLAVDLPGGAMTPEEAKQFTSERHKRLLLELLRRWEKEFRAQGGSK